MNENEFTYKGKKYKAVDTQGNIACSGCHFFNGVANCMELRAKGIRPPCSCDARQDGIYVIFIPTV